MARGILEEFGSESPGEQKPRATNGGEQKPKDVMGYQPPYGPMGIDNPKSPGLHGNVYRSGSQSAAIKGGESGSPGNDGTRRKGGSQR